MILFLRFCLEKSVYFSLLRKMLEAPTVGHIAYIQLMLGRKLANAGKAFGG